MTSPDSPYLVPLRAALERLQVEDDPVAHMIVMPTGVTPPSPWPELQFSGKGPTLKDWVARWQHHQIQLVPRTSWPGRDEAIHLTCSRETSGPIHAFWGAPDRIANLAGWAREYWRAVAPRGGEREDLPTSRLEWAVERLYGAAWETGNASIMTSVAGRSVSVPQAEVGRVLTWSATSNLVQFMHDHLAEVMAPIRPHIPPRLAKRYGLKCIGQAVQDVTPVSETTTPARLDALPEHEQHKTKALPDKQTGKPVGEDDADEQEQPPALTKHERMTLAALATFDSSCLASATEVSEAIPAAERLSDRTTRYAIKKLVKLALAERPEGDRQGARLTVKGRRLASKLAD